MTGSPHGLKFALTALDDAIGHARRQTNLRELEDLAERSRDSEYGPYLSTAAALMFQWALHHEPTIPDSIDIDRALRRLRTVDSEFGFSDIAGCLYGHYAMAGGEAAECAVASRRVLDNPCPFGKPA